MHKNLVILALTLYMFLLYGCLDAAENEVSSQPSSDYKITLQDGVLSISEQPIILPLPIDQATQKIGAYTRFADNANDIYTWDNDGFKLWSRPNKKNIFQIGIYVRKKKPVKEDRFSPTGTRLIDSRPKQDFSGTFILDGIKITKKIKFERLNAKKTGKKFNRTHWANQYKYYSKIPDTGQKYRVIVYLYDDRTINYVEIVYNEEIVDIDKKNTNTKKSSYERPNQQSLPRNSLNVPLSPALNALHKKEKRENMWKEYKEEYAFTDKQLTEFKKRYIIYEKNEQRKFNTKIKAIANRLKSGKITAEQAELETFKYIFNISGADLDNHSKSVTEINKTKDELSKTDTHLLNFIADTLLIKNAAGKRSEDIKKLADEVKKNY